MIYFVSYYWESKENLVTIQGFGSSEIYYSKKVKSWSDVEELQKAVETRLALGEDGHVVILNFQKLKR